jgi:hypothetical protein
VTGVECGGTMYGLLAGGHTGDDCLAALAVGLAPQTVEVSLRPERIVARTCATARVASWVPRSRRLRQLRSYRANLPSAASDYPSASRRACGSAPKRCAGDRPSARMFLVQPMSPSRQTCCSHRQEISALIKGHS